MDLVDESVSFCSKAARMLGLQAGRIPLQHFLDNIIRYSGDRDRFFTALKRARTGRKEFVTEFRANCGDDIRVFSIRGKTVYNGGQPLVLGVVSDATPTAQM